MALQNRRKMKLLKVTFHVGVSFRPVAPCRVANPGTGILDLIYGILTKDMWYTLQTNYSATKKGFVLTQQN